MIKHSIKTPNYDDLDKKFQEEKGLLGQSFVINTKETLAVKQHSFTFRG